jgi:ElaB/YqjD/DUF883 family membrane-anchored ribosome-binding protein
MGQWDERSGTSGSGLPKAGGNGSGAVQGTSDPQAQMQQAIEDARAQLDEYVEQAASFVRQRPVVCLAGALAVGYLVGKLASRR